MKKILFTLAIGLITLATTLSIPSLYANAGEKPQRSSLATSAARDQAKAGKTNLFEEQKMRQSTRGGKMFPNINQDINPTQYSKLIPQARVVGDTKIYGTVIAANNWGTDEWGLDAINYGVYSIMPSSEKGMTEIALDKNK